MNDLEIPQGCETPAQIVLDTVKRSIDDPTTGGCKAFYSHEEWRRRGETTGNGAVLIVAHDGGDLASFFSPTFGDPGFIQKMNEALEARGYYVEPAMSWCTAIYRDPVAGTHRLKTWPEYFDAVRRNHKTFELREDDRDFQVGDALVLEEWDPENELFTGDRIWLKVTYILRDAEEFGLKPGYCLLSVRHGCCLGELIEN